MPILLDTGALELLRRRDLRVEILAMKDYPPVLCPHVAGEYLHCQLQAKVAEAALTQARTYVAAFEMLHPTNHTADIYADLCRRIASQDRPPPHNPMLWIAAHALEHRLPLATTDRSFRQVPGLEIHLLHPRFIRATGT